MPHTVKSKKLLSSTTATRDVPRGFSFVTMNDDAAAREAIEAINGTDLDGRTLVVNEARPRENRGGGGFRRDRW